MDFQLALLKFVTERKMKIDTTNLKIVAAANSAPVPKLPLVNVRPSLVISGRK